VAADGDSSGSSSSSSGTRLGLIQLTDLEVNAAAVNGYLDGRPLRLVRGTVARVEVRVCYEKLLTEEGLKITLEGLDLLLAPAPPSAATAADAASSRRRPPAPSGASSDEEEEGDGGEGVGAAAAPPQARAAAAAAAAAAAGGGVEADSATGIIADWIEQMASQLRVEVKGLTVRVLASESERGEGPLLRLDVARVGYEDVTARYQGGAALGSAMVGGEGGAMGSAGAGAVPSPSCVSHKVGRMAGVGRFLVCMCAWHVCIRA
jgi:hypothetical protein